MADVAAAADRDLVVSALYEEYYSVAFPARSRSHWVMDADMWRLITGIVPFPPVGILYPPDPGAEARQTLLGLPVEIRAGADGARLEPDP